MGYRMTLPLQHEAAELINVEIRVRGRVQGVGFRPMVCRLAHELEVAGDVRNDPDGVLIRASGSATAIDRMIERLRSDAPPLARVERIETRLTGPLLQTPFHIGRTRAGRARTQVAPDAALCAACAREVLDPRERRHRYPFTNCTHCGPRLSIVTAIPYDRANTSMAEFALCRECAREYGDPADRRFHAEAIACEVCGPSVRFVPLHAQVSAAPHPDAVDAAAEALAQGWILAVKGLGGYQLTCDATNAGAVRRLRATKLRPAKPFALMARDLDLIRRYCAPTVAEERLLASSEAPIVLMRATGPEQVPEDVAPGLSTLGFMLPTTPLHLLMLRRCDRPVVMTSGNIADEPQITDDDEALRRFDGIADAALIHDRQISIRVDDSIVRTIDGAPRVLRRARGYAPAPITLPAGFEAAPPVLALGGDLKSTFCMAQKGEALLSQHQGDLDSATVHEDFRRNLAFYAELFGHTPAALACDQHPEYRASKLARERARHDGVRVIEVQHHHAHVAACLAENGRPLASPPVLGIALDGLGWGDDGTIWGGEFMLADYREFDRLGTFKPVPMIGGDHATREPWRSLYAHLMAEMSWAELSMNFDQLDLYRELAAKPRALLDQMIRQSVNAPRASSCGRLFDAVAAALGICRDRQLYEGEAASRLEAMIDDEALHRADELTYPFAIPSLPGSGLPYIEPLAMWKALLGDLILQTPAPRIAARFHKGLARAVVAMTMKLARRDSPDGPRFDTVALSGGCFQNATLSAEVAQQLRGKGFIVLSHARVPPNDGGLALGQAAIAAARLLAGRGHSGER
jgi:hydrogenase maturation protein HypF